jgi:hypothetical protein
MICRGSGEQLESTFLLRNRVELGKAVGRESRKEASVGEVEDFRSKCDRVSFPRHLPIAPSDSTTNDYALADDNGNADVCNDDFGAH